MLKPKKRGLYSADVTAACERVLVNLLRGLGPWKNSVFLIGGLVPRYIVKARPPDVPPHAGTGDVDIVIDLAILADTHAYRTLEENLQQMGFRRGENARGDRVNWRWTNRTDEGATVIIEFLADDPNLRGGALQELPTEGNISAVNIPHASMVFDLHDEIEVTADLFDGGGRTTERVAHANLVSFVCLKAFAMEHRREPKDAHDLVYCLEHAEGSVDGAIASFAEALKGHHADTIREALEIVARRFTDPDPDDGYLREGPVAVAQFEIPEEERDLQILRQRTVNSLVVHFLRGLARSEATS